MSIVIDEVLLEPISGDSSIGVDIREDSDASAKYYEVKDARSEARDIERQFGVGDPSEIIAEAAAPWRQVRLLAPKLLETTTKDLELACWYVEALARSDGFAGLADGFEFLINLVEKFWDEGLYPAEDEDGMETRVAPLTALNGLEGPGTLIRPIKMINMTDDVDLGPFAYWQYEQAVSLSKVTDPEVIQQMTDNGAVSLTDIKRGAGQSSREQLSKRYNDLTRAIDLFKRLSSIMQEKAKDYPPPSSNVLDTLGEVQRAFRVLAPDLAMEEQPTDEGVADEGTGESAGAVKQGGVQVATGAIANREDALRRLLEIAEFFDKNEPTSVVPLSLRDLVRRARMPLNELLTELLHDEPTARDNFLARAGIRPSSPNE